VRGLSSEGEVSRCWFGQHILSKSSASEEKEKRKQLKER
jgi:hypothetical protein